jgi:branched-chain amino acid transport system substrate-binding protein
LTGSVPVVGASCKNAAELAVKEINDAGGLDIKGKKYPVELLIEDNETKRNQPQQPHRNWQLLVLLQ